MGRFTTLMACGAVAAAMAASPTTAAAQTEVMVLGIQAIDGDDTFARSLTGALRHEASQVPGWSVPDRRVSLSQMVLAHGCEDADLSCISQVAEDLEADRVIYGTVERTRQGKDFDFALSLSMYDAETGGIAESIEDTVPRVHSDIDNLRPYAKRYVGRFSGHEVSGRLRVEANVPGAEVRVDGEHVGTTDENGRLVASDIAAGKRTVEVSAEGHDTVLQTVDVVPDQQSGVEVTLDGSMIASDPPAEAQPARIRWYTWVAAGATAAFAAGWGYTGIRALRIDNGSNALTRARDAETTNNNVCVQTRLGRRYDGVDADEVKSLCDEADLLEPLQWVFGAATLAAGAATAILLYRDLGSSGERGPDESPSVVVAPSFGPTGGAVNASVRF